MESPDGDGQEMERSGVVVQTFALEDVDAGGPTYVLPRQSVPGDTVASAEQEDTSEEQALITKITQLRKRLHACKRQNWEPITAPQEDTEVKDNTSKQTQKNIIIVANRLPVTLTRTPAGKWRFEKSSGGLASALRGIKNLRLMQIGWPGYEVALEDQEFVSKELMKLNCIPVFLPQRLATMFYNGFSNNVLWPLFHLIPLDIEQLQKITEEFEAYKQANLLFMEAVLNCIQMKQTNYTSKDVIWVHDYHLMLLPGQLRQKLPHAKIGFFLHIPFPGSEFYKQLPQRSQLLRGLLASNLVGFHVYDYALRFKGSCERILRGCESTPQCVNDGGRLSAVGAFPIGIDPEIWFNALEKNDAVKKSIASIRAKFKGKRIVLGVDRMDYVKGLEHKLLAWEKFLRRSPQWVGKVILIQIAVPSRKGIRRYQELAKNVHTIVGRVNGTYGTVDYVPIRFLDQTIKFELLAALYHVSEACLITSLRDGMNLVAYEYVACQGRSEAQRKGTFPDETTPFTSHINSPPRSSDSEHTPSSPTEAPAGPMSEHPPNPGERPGVLLLSEFTGAAQSLGAGAIRLNPWDIELIADKIRYALEMQNVERRVYHRYALQYVMGHTAQKWATDFLSRLEEAHGEITERAPIVPKKFQIEPVLTAFRGSKHRLIILGLVGTITQPRPKEMLFQHFLRFAKVPQDTKDGLRTMAADENTTIVIATSRRRDYAMELLGEDLGVWVCAENGYFIKRGTGEPWTCTTGRDGADDLSWMIETERVMTYFKDRTPNAFIERSEGSMNFEYHDSEEAHGEDQARKLMETLRKGALLDTATEVTNLSKVVQVRLAGVRKVDLVQRLIDEVTRQRGAPPDFMLVAGDFLRNDEAMFQNLNNATSANALERKAERKRLGDFKSNRESGQFRAKHFPEPHTYEDAALPTTSKVFTCCIPRKASYAQRFLKDPQELAEFLKSLSVLLPPPKNSKIGKMR